MESIWTATNLLSKIASVVNSTKIDTDLPLDPDYM